MSEQDTAVVLTEEARLINNVIECDKKYSPEKSTQVVEQVSGKPLDVNQDHVKRVTSEVDILLEYLLSEFKDPSEYQITKEIIKTTFDDINDRLREKPDEEMMNILQLVSYGTIPLVVMRYILGIKKYMVSARLLKNWGSFTNRYIGVLPNAG